MLNKIPLHEVFWNEKSYPNEHSQFAQYLFILANRSFPVYVPFFLSREKTPSRQNIFGSASHNSSVWAEPIVLTQ